MFRFLKRLILGSHPYYLMCCNDILHFFESAYTGEFFSFLCEIYCSGSVATENMIPALDTGEGIMSSSQPSSGFQPAWVGIPGQLSMADIVKMGRPHGKASLSHHNVSPPPLGVSNQNLHPSQNHSSVVSEAQIEGGFSSRDIHANDEWPLIEHPPSSNWPPPVEAHVNSILFIDRTNQRLKSQLDDIEVTEDGHVAHGNYISHATVSGRNMQDDDSLGSHSFEQNEGDLTINNFYLQFDFHYFKSRTEN